MNPLRILPINNIVSELKIDLFRSAQMQCATDSPTEQPKYRYDRHCERLKVPAEIVLFLSLLVVSDVDERTN